MKYLEFFILIPFYIMILFPWLYLSIISLIIMPFMYIFKGRENRNYFKEYLHNRIDTFKHLYDL